MPIELGMNANGDGNMHALNEKFGERPGNKVLDPYWFKRGMNKKIYLWNEPKKKWYMVKMGDQFDFDEEGNVVCVNR